MTLDHDDAMPSEPEERGQHAADRTETDDGYVESTRVGHAIPCRFIAGHTTREMRRGAASVS